MYKSNKFKVVCISFGIIIVVGLYFIFRINTKNDIKQAHSKAQTVIKNDLSESHPLQKKLNVLSDSKLFKANEKQNLEDTEIFRIEVDFFRLKDDELLISESGFGQTYKKVHSFESTSEKHEYEILFKESIKNVASVVILVDQGAIELETFQLNDQTKTGNSKQYFNGDWVKKEPLEPLKKVQFKSKLLTPGRVRVSLYVQYLGD